MAAYLQSVVCKLVSVLVLISPALCVRASSAAVDSMETFTVQGIVINSATGRPVPRALVQLSPGQQAMLTDARGQFSFDHVPQGVAQVVVTKPSFVDHGASFLSGKTNSILVGPGMERVVLKLTPAVTIYGEVMTRDDEPMVKASVEVLALLRMNGRRQLRVVRSGVPLDAEGRFRVGGLAPGQYYVAVRPGTSSLNSLGFTLKETAGFPKLVYYPSSPDLDSATPIDLQPGTRMEVRFTVEPVPNFKVAGSLVNVAGWKQVDTPVLLDQTGKPLIQPDRFDQRSGEFQFSAVPAGHYLLRREATDSEGRHSASIRDLTVETDITDLRLPIYQGIDIPVTEQAEFERPHKAQCMAKAQSKSSSGCVNLPPVRLELRSFDSITPDFFSEPVAQNSTAVVRVNSVAPGKYLVRARMVTDGYVRSLRCGDTDLLTEPLIVPEGGGLPPIEVVVRDDSATMNIQVRADRATQEILLAVFSDASSIFGPQLTQTGSAASPFVSGPIAPGAYTIFAFDAADDIDYSDPTVLARYASQAARVNLDAGENTNVTVDVIHVGE